MSSIDGIKRRLSRMMPPAQEGVDLPSLVILVPNSYEDMDVTGIMSGDVSVIRAAGESLEAMQVRLLMQMHSAHPVVLASFVLQD
jgi:hypothetical protein